MRWTISRKLFVALLIVSMMILVMSALFGRLSFQSGFNAYLAAREAPVVARLASDLAVEYVESGWEQLRADPRRLADFVLAASPRRSGRSPGRPQIPSNSPVTALAVQIPLSDHHHPRRAESEGR